MGEKPTRNFLIPGSKKTAWPDLRRGGRSEGEMGIGTASVTSPFLVMIRRESAGSGNRGDCDLGGLGDFVGLDEEDDFEDDFVKEA